MLTAIKIIQLAKKQGFDLAGIIPLKEYDKQGYYQKYLDLGYFGQMLWLKQSRLVRREPKKVFRGAKSIISLAVSYFPNPKVQAAPKNKGVIARFAWFDDYHQTMGRKLNQLSQKIDHLAGKKVCLENCVDSAIFLEKEIAQQAGLGFIGKNTQLITPEFGSFVLLAEIVLDVKIKSSNSTIKSECYQCTRCLSACPTQALVKPYLLDARKCISYLTIENKGSIPRALRNKLGLNIFGCDRCQEVCPHNRKISLKKHAFFQIKRAILNRSLFDWLKITNSEFNRVFKNSPFKRTHYQGFIRNVIVALGNLGAPKAVPGLKSFLKSDHKILSEHAGWAIRAIKNHKFTR